MNLINTILYIIYFLLTLNARQHYIEAYYFLIYEYCDNKVKYRVRQGGSLLLHSARSPVGPIEAENLCPIVFDPTKF